MYKTIVVHLSGSTSTPATLRVAASLARQSESHLIGTATSGLAEMAYLLAAGAPMAIVPPDSIDTLRGDANQQLQAFEQHCRQQDVHSFETRLFETSASDSLLLQSRYCDLMVVGRDDVEGSMLVPALLPGALVTQAARPVLIVPPDAAPDAVYKTIFIGWNGSLAASRAVIFGMPLLRRAEKIIIGVCNPHLEGIDAGHEPGADLASYLARQHDNVEVLRYDSDAEPGSVLLGLARSHDADLVLAGAYGHSRMHDWVLGSTTRSLIAQSHVPLLMAH